MGWINKMADSIRTGIKSFLRIEPAINLSEILINEKLNFETNAIKNTIWYRGDSEEISQLYSQMDAQSTMFWKATCTKGREIRKIHTGLPSLIVDTLVSITIADLNDIEVPDAYKDTWTKIAEENDFKEIVSQALTQVLYIGDGAFKINMDSEISDLPIIEFVSGERVDFVRKRGRITEIIFKTMYTHNRKTYVLCERYGKGYIKYDLTLDGNPVPIEEIPQTQGLETVEVKGEPYFLAVPFSIYHNSKWEGRGKSIFDGKIDAFDSFDECFSQWMDALRKGRSKEYIPTSLIPKNQETGEILKPNAFDDSYIEVGDSMAEDAKAEIKLIQANIPHESYLSTYITALDLCLQGLISPSTLGIDTKKLDNADAQREKEKTTLYTRNKIVGVLQKTLPKVVQALLNVYNTALEKPIKEQKIDVPFGEYANPSFESQVETVGKGKMQGIMSIEASVDELYGDSKDEEWKKGEVLRLKAEQGIEMMEEPSVKESLGGFVIDIEEGQENASKSREQNVGNAQTGVQRPSKDSQ